MSSTSRSGASGSAWAATLPSVAEAERSRQREQVREPSLELGEPVLPVDEERLHAERPRSFHVVLGRIADHRRLLRLDAELLEGGAEDRRVRLRLPVRARAD